MASEAVALERTIHFEPAYDSRAQDCGVHGVDAIWWLKGPLGAVEFVLYTSWDLRHVAAELGFRPPLPADIRYHSPKPMSEDQKPETVDCKIIGGACFSAGSALNSNAYFDVLVEQGGEALWEKMEEYYHAVFDPKESGDV